MFEKFKGISKGALIRGGLLVLALLNSALQLAGYDVLPFTEEDVETVITVVFNFIAMGAAYWKNNSLTKEAKQADEEMKAKKAKKKALKKAQKGRR
ncbi:phage holin [Oceanobacillus sojae]|uniref:phage holin n=1 Tax=Oceanobacillus sojae TaxID=582851 RepID=UPI00098844A8|nr:phage holin [Oceanobacillus sojae]